VEKEGSSSIDETGDQGAGIRDRENDFVAMRRIWRLSAIEYITLEIRD
jgi:hypothetical protein